MLLAILNVKKITRYTPLNLRTRLDRKLLAACAALLEEVKYEDKHEMFSDNNLAITTSVHAEEVCEIDRTGIVERIKNRSYPSVYRM